MFTSLISPLSWFTSFPLRAATSTPRLLTRILGHVHFAHFSFTLVYFFPPQGRHIHTQALDSHPWSCHFAHFSFTLVYFFLPQGRHIHTQALDSRPWCMTVMDIRTQTSWDLCVTLPNARKINIMRVTPNSVNIKVSECKRRYSSCRSI